MNLSLVSRMRELSIVGFPSLPTERRERGTILQHRSFISVKRSSMSTNVPDGLIILFFSRPRLKESVLANVDSTFGFSDLNDWIAYLGPRFEHVPQACRLVHTFVTQLLIILGTSTPLASAIPNHRSLVRPLSYRHFLR
jgi:hypothetical protein